MNKLGIFMNFWEKNWDADHAKYIRKAKDIGFDVLEFQAQPLLEMSDEKIRSLKALADEVGIELTYSLGLDRAYDVSSLDENIRKGGVEYLQNIVRKMYIGGGGVVISDALTTSAVVGSYFGSTARPPSLLPSVCSWTKIN